MWSSTKYFMNSIEYCSYVEKEFLEVQEIYCSYIQGTTFTIIVLKVTRIHLEPGMFAL